VHVKHNNFESGTILPMIKSDQQRITQHKRFVPHGTHPNPSLTLRTSFMLEMLYDIDVLAEDLLTN